MNTRSFRKEDWLQVKEIYEQGMATGQATFEMTVPSFEKWKSTIAENLCLVAVLDSLHFVFNICFILIFYSQ
jgi:L-amino acid N-acyltransferase YncA